MPAGTCSSIDWLKRSSGPPRSKSQCMIGVGANPPVAMSATAPHGSPITPAPPPNPPTTTPPAHHPPSHPTHNTNTTTARQTPPPSRPPNHNRLRHTRVPNQRGLDLPRLNAEAANLNLMVRSPHKLQNPIPAPARQVP